MMKIILVVIIKIKMTISLNSDRYLHTVVDGIASTTLTGLYPLMEWLCGFEFPLVLTGC